MERGAPEPLITRRAAVIGHPVAHSLSPVMHRAAYAALGLDGWSYEVVDVDEPEIGGFLASLDASWAGLSVTMPLKRAVRGYLDSQSDLAVAVGAVNTVVLREDGRHGYNTDVHGIIRALAEAGAEKAADAVVLGGGATAASTLAALRDLGCEEPAVLVRSPERSGDLLAAAERLEVRPRLLPLTVEQAVAAVRERAQNGGRGAVVVSTLPAYAGDYLARPVVEAVVAASRGTGPLPALLDVVYAPWPTALATAWSDAGGAASGGFAMLVNQAEGQVRLMTGAERAPIDVMRAAGQTELLARARPAGAVQGSG